MPLKNGKNGVRFNYPFRPVAEWVFGNGRLFQRTLNQNYQPGIVQDGFSGGLSLGYEFDAVGNLSTLRNGDQTDPPQRLFGYDALNRLTDARDGATSALLEGYTYDATGNRQSATAGTLTTDYTTEVDSHRLSAVGTVTRSYDPAGSTTSIGGTERQFVYDASGRMSQVLRNNAVAMNYRYNGKGEQVHRYLGTGNYQYALANSLLYTDPTGHNPLIGCAAGVWAGPVGCGVGAVVGALVGGATLAVIMSTPSDSSAVKSSSVPYPDRRRGKYTCICRANRDGRSSENCSIDNQPFAFGYGEGHSLSEAKKAAEKNAKENLGAMSTHHIQCRCTGPNGDRIIPHG